MPTTVISTWSSGAAPLCWAAFAKSIDALRTLNGLGYGRPDSGLTLTLVYNPIGPSLPPDQATLEADYREHLRTRYGVEFTRLFAITNMPISRFLEDLLDAGRYDDYMTKLVAAFNPAAVAGLMCRNTLSVSWDGRLYDCGDSREGHGYRDVTDSNDPEVVAARQRFEALLAEMPAPAERE